MSISKSITQYLARKRRVNAKIKTSGCPHRAIVNKSLMYDSLQVVDTQGHIIVGGFSKGCAGETKSQRAHTFGEKIAKKLIGLGVTTVVFDRNGHSYHGRVKALAEGLRAGGLTV